MFNRHSPSPSSQPETLAPASRSWRRLALTLACGLSVALAVGASAAEPAAKADANKAAGHKSLRTMSWGDKLKEAGVVGVVQLGMSAFGAIFIFERLFGLRRKNLVPEGLTARAKKLWQDGKFEDLEKLGHTEPSTQARVISFIAQNRKSPMAEVSEVAGDLVSRELAMHHQRAYPLGIVATLAPLLGLLGMIFGMITTFETVAMAGALGDPTQLASGISEALVTTGLGLAVAIPFLALYHFFKYRTNGYGVLLEGEVTSLLTAWFMNRENR
jgi:biopolymer transport protein ExbB